MLLFKEFWKNKNEIGSVAPSSPFLIRKMLKPVDFSRKLVIAEYGPGTGALTLPLLRRMNKQSVLISIESNKNLYHKLRVLECQNSNFRVVNDSAENIDSILKHIGVISLDYIISSLPLAVIEKPVRSAIVDNASRYLSPGGIYMQYQYSMEAYSLLSSVFSRVKRGFCIMNIPPAIIYYCSKS